MDAQQELSKSREERLQAERYRRQTEVEATKAAKIAIKEAKTRARQLVQVAASSRAEAEFDREQARKELEHAKEARIEADEHCRRLKAEAVKQAEIVLWQASEEAERQAAEIRERAAEKARKITEEISVLREAVQEELETQKILSEAGRVKLQTVTLDLSDLDTLADFGPIDAPETFAPVEDDGHKPTAGDGSPNPVSTPLQRNRRSRQSNGSRRLK